MRRLGALCLLAFALARGDAAGAQQSGLGPAASPGGAPVPVLEARAQRSYRDGDFDGATALYRRALATARAAFGARSMEAAQAEARLGAAYVDMQRYLDAEPLLIAARIELRAQRGKRLAPVLSALARIALARGEPRRAEELARRAVANDRGYPGPADLGRSAGLRVLGAALAAERRFAEGERILAAALELARHSEREPGAATAQALSELARLDLRQDRYREALPFAEEAILIDQDRLAPDHPVLAGDWFDLGVAYFGVGRVADAERAFRTAAERLDRGPGRQTAGAANVELGLARIRHKRGDDREAGALFEDAHRILEEGAREERRRERRT